MSSSFRNNLFENCRNKQTSIVLLRRTNDNEVIETTDRTEAQLYAAELNCPKTKESTYESLRVRRGHIGTSEGQAKRLLENEANRDLCKFCIYAAMTPAEAEVFLGGAPVVPGIDEIVNEFRRELDRTAPEDFV